MNDDQFKAWLARQDKEASHALESRNYGNPANVVMFQREKGEYMDDIKELLKIWAGYYHDGLGAGYPKQSPFATERVQTSNRSTETYRDIPAEVVRLNECIEGNKDKGIAGLPPGFRRIIALEYRDKRPAKTKAAVMGIPRQLFYARLAWVHELLNFAMWGK